MTTSSLRQSEGQWIDHVTVMRQMDGRQSLTLFRKIAEGPTFFHCVFIHDTRVHWLDLRVSMVGTFSTMRTGDIFSCLSFVDADRILRLILLERGKLVRWFLVRWIWNLSCTWMDMEHLSRKARSGEEWIIPRIATTGVNSFPWDAGTDGACSDGFDWLSLYCLLHKFVFLSGSWFLPSSFIRIDVSTNNPDRFLSVQTKARNIMEKLIIFHAHSRGWVGMPKCASSNAKHA